MKRRLLAFFLIILLFLVLLPVPTVAATQTFVATNNLMLPMTDAMPIKSDGVWYVDYQCFSAGDLNVNVSYNAADQTLALYTWNTTLAFDIAKGSAYNTTNKTSYTEWSFAANGTIYVPARFTAQQLGITYSYLANVSVIRFKNKTELSDTMFAYIAADEIPRIIARYNASKPLVTPPKDNNQPTQPSQPTTGTTGQPEIPDKTPTLSPVVLTFDVTNNTPCQKILDLLDQYQYKAVFFVQGSAVATQDDAIRRMAAAGHTIGISSMGNTGTFLNSPETVASELQTSNQLLYNACYTKSRLARMPSGSRVLSDTQADALINAGFRYWDWDIDASSKSITKMRTILSARTSQTVLRFDGSKNSAKNLSVLLAYLKEQNCSVQTISIFDTPRNQRSDNR